MCCCHIITRDLYSCILQVRFCCFISVWLEWFEWLCWSNFLLSKIIMFNVIFIWYSFMELFLNLNSILKSVVYNYIMQLILLDLNKNGIKKHNSTQSFFKLVVINNDGTMEWWNEGSRCNSQFKFTWFTLFSVLVSGFWFLTCNAMKCKLIIYVCKL